MNIRALTKLKKQIEQNGGATVDRHGETSRLHVGYMVSLKGYELVLQDLKYLELRQVKSYLKKAKKLNAYVGFWLDKQKIYLDLSINVSELHQALKIAKENEQLAVFDCKNNVSIYL